MTCLEVNDSVMSCASIPFTGRFDTITELRITGPDVDWNYFGSIFPAVQTVKCTADALKCTGLAPVILHLLCACSVPTVPTLLQSAGMIGQSSATAIVDSVTKIMDGLLQSNFSAEVGMTSGMCTAGLAREFGKFLDGDPDWACLAENFGGPFGLPMACLMLLIGLLLLSLGFWRSLRPLLRYLYQKTQWKLFRTRTARLEDAIHECNKMNDRLRAERDKAADVSTVISLDGCHATLPLVTAHPIVRNLGEALMTGWIREFSKWSQKYGHWFPRNAGVFDASHPDVESGQGPRHLWHPTASLLSPTASSTPSRSFNKSFNGSITRVQNEDKTDKTVCSPLLKCRGEVHPLSAVAEESGGVDKLNESRSLKRCQSDPSFISVGSPNPADISATPECYGFTMPKVPRELFPTHLPLVKQTSKLFRAAERKIMMHQANKLSSRTLSSKTFRPYDP